jgi:hypothetical protein
MELLGDKMSKVTLPSAFDSGNISSQKSMFLTERKIDIFCFTEIGNGQWEHDPTTNFTEFSLMHIFFYKNKETRTPDKIQSSFSYSHSDLKFIKYFTDIISAKQALVSLSLILPVCFLGFLLLFVHLFVFGFWNRAHCATQAASMSWSSCLSLPSAGITDVYHYARLVSWILPSLLIKITHESCE